jgi:hypothetical protein
MPPTCSVCAHDNREAITDALLRGKSSRGIARQFGLPAHDAVDRHRECIREKIRKADQSEARFVLTRATRLCDKLERMADEAHDAKQNALFLMTVRELRPTLLLVGQASGEIVSANIEAMLRQLGVNDVHEAERLISLARGAGEVSFDAMAEEWLEAGRILLREAPELVQNALVTLQREPSRAEVIEPNGTHGSNGHEPEA